MLSDQGLRKAVRILSKQDADLAWVVKLYGPPPLWAREPGYATLVHIILEQQVSLASAKAAFDRLKEAISLKPEHFLRLDDFTLRAIGFSRQKTAYVRNLSQAVLAGFDLEGLHLLDDLEVRVRLMGLKGIGHWSADIYLLMALGRPDVWPVGDLALQVAYKRLKNLEARPSLEEFEAISQPWKPWRAVAARILWHYYLSERKNQIPSPPAGYASFAADTLASQRSWVRVRVRGKRRNWRV